MSHSKTLQTNKEMNKNKKIIKINNNNNFKIKINNPTYRDPLKITVTYSMKQNKIIPNLKIKIKIKITIIIVLIII